jgi:hypothetical protein
LAADAIPRGIGFDRTGIAVIIEIIKNAMADRLQVHHFEDLSFGKVRPVMRSAFSCKRLSTNNASDIFVRNSVKNIPSSVLKP